MDNIRFSPEGQKEVKELVDKYFAENPDIKMLVSVEKLFETNALQPTSKRICHPENRRKLLIKCGNLDIIDPRILLSNLYRAYNWVTTTVAALNESRTLPLFIDTKDTNYDIVKNLIIEKSQELNTLYITKRWLGGTLTNFSTLSNSIKHFNSLKNLQKSEDWVKYNKKEQFSILHDIKKYEDLIGGISRILSNNSTPSNKLNSRDYISFAVITDYYYNHIAIKELQKCKIPFIALYNTNVKPIPLGYKIPINTYSPQAVWLIMSIIFDGIAKNIGRNTSVVDKDDDQIIIPEKSITKKEVSNVVVGISSKKHSK